MTTANAPDRPVQVVHALPGRIRLRLPILQSQPQLADRVLAAGLAQPGVRSVRINLTCGSVVVEYDPAELPDLPIQRVVHHWLTQAPPKSTRPAAGPPVPAWRRLAPIALALSGLTFSLIGGPAGPGLALAVTALGALPIAQRAILASVTERRLTVDHLDSAAVVAMFALGDLRGAALMCLLVASGEEIRDRTARRSRRAALDLEGALGRSAWLVHGRTKTRVPVDQLKIQQVVVAYSGDLIPVDGLVIDGVGTVDQKTLTGESRPILKAPGERVLAATVVTDGKLYIRAEAVGNATRAGWIVQTLNEAPIHDTRAANQALRVADRLVLPTFLLAGIASVATRSLARLAAILIVDFATGIRVSAPTTVLATMTRAAREGILIKSGRAIEQLAAVDVVIFDKTGTLTRGEPEVSAIVSLDAGWPADRILALAAAAEIRLRHPTARALVRHARDRRVAIPDRDSSRYSTGLGVLASVEGHRVRVGSARYLEAAGLDLDPAEATGRRYRAAGGSIVYVAIDDRTVGVIAYQDPPRPESAGVVNWLHQQGIAEVLMVTGDDPEAAESVARTVGIDRVHAGALPEDKAAIVRELQRQGHRVAVIGDGINDSPALALADVSISLHQGADAARETADIVLMEPDLDGLPRAIELARDCLGIIRQNLIGVAVPGVGALGLATVGALNPVGTTLLSNGSAIAAALNSLRPLLMAPPSRSADGNGIHPTAAGRG